MFKRSKQQNKFQQVLTNSKQSVKNRAVPSLLILPNKINPTRYLMRRMQGAK